MKEEKFYQLLGANIARLRLESGISQEKLGDFLELTRASIVNIEKGRQRPSVYMVACIAKYFSTSLERILPNFEIEEFNEEEKVTFYDGIDVKTINQNSIKDFVELTRIL